jgi:hypothetical protein
MVAMFERQFVGFHTGLLTLIHTQFDVNRVLDEILIVQSIAIPMQDFLA